MEEGSFVPTKFKNHLAVQGTLRRFICPYTPQQAGVVERNKSIVEIGLTQPFHANSTGLLE